MKEIKTTRYICELCLQPYELAEDALKCERLPIIYDKGVKIGDVVLITKGEGAGEKAKVSGVYVVSPNWHPRYAHAINLSADLLDGSGTRTLTFDSYSVIEAKDQGYRRGGIMSEWIKCSERLPKNDRFVLVISKYGEIFECFFDGQWKYSSSNFITLDWPRHITHWRPRPKAPKD